MISLPNLAQKNKRPDSGQLRTGSKKSINESAQQVSSSHRPSMSPNTGFAQQAGNPKTKMVHGLPYMEEQPMKSPI